MKTSTDKISASLSKVLDYAAAHDYKGYNKYDALDSKFRWFMSFGSKFLRLVYSQVVMRAPINIRPLFFVPKTRNPKGIALFAMAFMNLYKAKQVPEDLAEAGNLEGFHQCPPRASAGWVFRACQIPRPLAKRPPSSARPKVIDSSRGVRKIFRGKKSWVW